MAKLMLVGGGERELPDDDFRQTDRGVEWTDGEDVTPRMHHIIPWTAILELVMTYHEPQVAFVESG